MNSKDLFLYSKMVETETNLTVIPLVDKSIKNERNIPTMIFIENIPEFCIKYGAEQLVEELNVYYNKYKYLEAQTQRHSESIKLKIPDIEKAIESVEFLREKLIENKNKNSNENVKLEFMVAHNLWAKADVPVTDKVCLWLGANILCEYTHDEAIELLNKNLNNAKNTLQTNESNTDFIRDQITVCEVNISRAYNEYIEKNKKKTKESEEKIEKKKN